MKEPSTGLQRNMQLAAEHTSGLRLLAASCLVLGGLFVPQQAAGQGSFTATASGATRAQLEGEAKFGFYRTRAGPEFSLCLDAALGQSGMERRIMISRTGQDLPSAGRHAIGNRNDEGRLTVSYTQKNSRNEREDKLFFGEKGTVHLDQVTATEIRGRFDITGNELFEKDTRVTGEFVAVSASNVCDQRDYTPDAVADAAVDEMLESLGVESYRPTSTEAQIVGFSSIPWGSPREEIIRRNGPPLSTDTGHEQVERLAYQDTVLGKPTVVVYYVHPENGLISGGYSAPFSMGGDCEQVYEAFRSNVAARYHSIRPEGEKRNTSALNFCSGVTIGKASAMARWTDPFNGAVAVVRLDPEAKSVLTVYSSKEGIAWQERSAAAERQSRF